MPPMTLTLRTPYFCPRTPTTGPAKYKEFVFKFLQFIKLLLATKLFGYETIKLLTVILILVNIFYVHNQVPMKSEADKI